MIVAMANNRVIGANNAMPWHLPADLKHFKQTTFGKPIIMGRKTYESIGKALPGRLNIVVSTRSDLILDDATVVTSCEQAVLVAQDYWQAQKTSGTPEVMIIGGGTIYEYFLALCHKLYLTQITLDVKGDTYFPDYQAKYQWQEVASQTYQADPNNPYAYRFITLEKRNG